MPSIAETARSMGVVTKPRTVSALAPMYTVVMRIDVDSICGYWRTGRALIARQPMARMIRFTTTARTGRLMKMSVNDGRIGCSWGVAGGGGKAGERPGRD